MKPTFPEACPIIIVSSKTAEQLGRKSDGSYSIFLDFHVT